MKLEINALIRQMATDRDIDPGKLLGAVEEAISSAARKQYKEQGVRTEIDPETGEVSCWKVRSVVDEVEDPETEMTLEEAREHDADIEVGGELRWPLETDHLGRIAAQSARQVLFQRVREAERAVVYENYSDRLGEMLNGLVKRIDRGSVIVELGDTEGMIPRSHQVRGERYGQGDRVRAVVVDVTMDASRPQVILSRTDPRLLEKLLEMEVPEIYDGTVIIKGCKREPGDRAKVAVFSRDRDVDPVGACVGLKGSRVQAITRELKGEKIDIVPWSDDLVSYAQNALAPAKINRVAVREEMVNEPVLDEETGRPALDEDGDVVLERRPGVILDVIVGPGQLSLAIGRRGQNVRLASKLLGCRIEIKSEEAVKDELATALADMLRDMQDEAEEQLETPAEPQAPEYDYDQMIPLEDLEGITERLRERLIEHGLHTVQDVLDRSPEQLAEIPGIGPVTAEGLLETARQALVEMTTEEDAEKERT